jgi:hypothetical protein
MNVDVVDQTGKHWRTVPSAWLRVEEMWASSRNSAGSAHANDRRLP